MHLIGVLTNSHTPGFELVPCMRLQVPAEPLCGLLHHNLVHTVEPNAHQATQACCACRAAAAADYMELVAMLAAAAVAHTY